MGDIVAVATNQGVQGDVPDTTVSRAAAIAKPGASFGEFPDKESVRRLLNYEYYGRLFYGRHFEAFRIRIDDDDYNRAYSKLRYVTVNFAGLISKIVADMLFSEPLVIKTENGDQEFIEALWRENQMDIQCYESALGNSYNGDAVFKVRKDERNKCVIEDTTPKVFFPTLNSFNVRAEPKDITLAWNFKKDSKDYLRKEIHTVGKIENQVWEMEGDKMIANVGIGILGDVNIKDKVDTKIDRNLVTHVPNWKTGETFFGMSDYFDMDSLFYALNNRVSSVDNILDKHSDPILMVPPGVLDEKGRVKKKALGVIEMGEGEDGKPEYIVWDASLENAFKEIEKLVEFMYLVGEISPDVLGLGEGVSDSGRALKFKLMRTIAKVARKKLYYDRAIKETLYVAQKLAKAWNLEIDGKKLTKDPVIPDLIWADGLPIDNGEQIETEIKALDAGLTDKKDAIMRVYGYDESEAEEKAKKIEDEKKIAMPETSLGSNLFNKKKVSV